MPVMITIHQNIDGCWPDLERSSCVGGEIFSVAVVHQGMSDGSPALCIRCQLDDGRSALVLTSLALLRGVVEELAQLDAKTVVHKEVVGGTIHEQEDH